MNILTLSIIATGIASSRSILMMRRSTFRRHDRERAQAIGDLFAGFCKDPKEGGLKGITFKAEQSTKIGDVFATQMGRDGTVPC